MATEICGCLARSRCLQKLMPGEHCKRVTGRAWRQPAHHLHHVQERKQNCDKCLLGRCNVCTSHVSTNRYQAQQLVQAGQSAKGGQGEPRRADEHSERVPQQRDRQAEQQAGVQEEVGRREAGHARYARKLAPVSALQVVGQPAPATDGAERVDDGGARKGGQVPCHLRDRLVAEHQRAAPRRRLHCRLKLVIQDDTQRGAGRLLLERAAPALRARLQHERPQAAVPRELAHRFARQRD
mmetsp:Transcript_9661/g.24610  ORF Transcript_9661/g.24610 Transcript_9661/m.24610 type:complete len:239 (-) Transcript_9661:434-1150(-)